MSSNYYGTKYRQMIDLMMPRKDFVPHAMATLRGVPVDATEHIPEFQTRWVFPERRFVQFEKSDEWWARKLGFGHEAKERLVYKIGSTLMMHPKTLEAFLEEPNLQTSGSQV